MTSSVASVQRQPDPEWSFGDRLRKVRVRYGATQRQFAEELGVKHPTYAAWEADRTSCPRETAVAKRIEVLTGTRAAWTLGVDDGAPPQPPPPLSAPPDPDAERRFWSDDARGVTGRYVRSERHLVAVATEVTPILPSPCVPVVGVTDEPAA